MSTWIRAGASVLACCLVGLLACDSSGQPGAPTAKGSVKQGGLQPSDPNALELVFTYGSEKEEWLKDVTAVFNAQKNKSKGGKPIVVKAVPIGSGELVEEVLTEKRKPHLVSPASGAYLVLGNADSKAKSGKELVGKSRNLVLSPVVIAMWKPMAEALGWGKKPIGWAELKELAEKEEGWGSVGSPQWGKFKFGHTHPEHSNSGLISVLAEYYAGAGKSTDLTVEDLQKPETAKFVETLERSVVHYGSSTGFFGRKLFENGPQYLSAAVLYENMVIESYGNQYKDKLPFPVVAIYPKEGTFWSDHPVAIVQRDWVTPEHAEAADLYIKFLMEKPQQEKALKYGFRPGLEEVPVTAPIDEAHGVDPKGAKLELLPPSAEVMKAALKSWQQHKRHAQVTVVFDTSGSMQKEGRLANAKLGAEQLLGMLGDSDQVSIVSFSTSINMVEKGTEVGKSRAKLVQTFKDFFPGGETALYDAVETGYKHLESTAKPEMIQAVVVLTDGEDNKSKVKLEELLQRVRIDYEKRPIRVFTIAYGSEAKIEILKKIADATQAKSYEGSPENIRKVFGDIATFF